MNEEPTVNSSPNTQQSHTMRHLGLQLPLVLALIIIGGMLMVWKPWQAQPTSGDRTITVTGEASVTAEPDQFTFRPQYEFKTASKQTGIEASTTKTNDIVKELKKLGVQDSKIKTDTNGYDNYYDNTGSVYYSSITVVVTKKDLAQKVQDYLLSTSPSGSVTPSADFSKSKKKQLIDDGRNQATKDARAKADQSAQNLGFTVGKVKSVKDQPDSYGNPAYGINSRLELSANAADSAKSAPIQQGENDQTYQVTVTYYVR